MKKVVRKSVLLLIVLFALSCEGEFLPNGQTILPAFSLTLVEPENNTVCLVQGNNQGTGDWFVRFAWSVQGDYNGQFNLVLRDDTGTEIFNQNTSALAIDNVSVPPGTRITWQVTTDDVNISSNTSIVVSPSSRGSSSPPFLSALEVTPQAGQFLISFSAIDPDGDFSSNELFINGNSQGTFGNNVSTLKSFPTGSVEIRAVATDNAGNTSDVTRTYSN